PSLTGPPVPAGGGAGAAAIPGPAPGCAGLAGFPGLAGFAGFGAVAVGAAVPAGWVSEFLFPQPATSTAASRQVTGARIVRLRVGRNEGRREGRKDGGLALRGCQAPRALGGSSVGLPRVTSCEFERLAWAHSRGRVLRSNGCLTVGSSHRSLLAVERQA